ncbi:MAG: hypothetical protein MI919_36580, partial [Holophagales bacterium]|nr:hypothetical protein [Holophagales bacterium]
SVAGGLVATILLAALLPLAARGLATRVIHPEDAWVEKRGGRLEPERWTLQRPAYRGGWLLTSGAELEARVVAPGLEAVASTFRGPPSAEAAGERGARPVDVIVHARKVGRGPKVLELRAGKRTLARIELEDGPWQASRIEALAWPVGRPLVLTCPEKYLREDVGIAVDRVELDWN